MTNRGRRQPPDPHRRGVRAVYRGEMGSSEALLGTALTLGLLVIGVYYGARVFRKESA